MVDISYLKTTAKGFLDVLQEDVNFDRFLDQGFVSIELGELPKKIRMAAISFEELMELRENYNIDFCIENSTKLSVELSDQRFSDVKMYAEFKKDL